MTINNKPYLIEIGGQEFNSSLNDVEEPLRFMYKIKEKKIDKKDRCAAFKGFNSYEEASRWINNNRELSIHEVSRCGEAGLYQRIFLDIDYTITAEDNKDEINRAYSVLNEAVAAVLSSHGVNNNDRYNLNGSHSSKFGIHDIYKYALINANCYKCFCKELSAIFKLKLAAINLDVKYATMIDEGVYNKNHPLRVHLSPKPGGAIVYKDANGTNDRFDYKTLICYNPQQNGERVDLYECGAECLQLKSKDPIKLPENVGERMKQAEAAINENLKVHGITTRRNYDNIIELWDDHKNPCYVCGKKHDNDHPYCIVGENSARICCRRAKTPQGKDMSVLLMNFENRYMVPASMPLAAESITDNSLFIETSSRRIEGLTEQLRKHSTLYINSDLDTGKSYAFINHIRGVVKEEPNYSCVIVTYRVNLAYEIFAKNYTENRILIDGEYEFNEKNHVFENYQTLPKGPIKISKHPRIIIQYESLHRLILDADVKLTFIDEGASLLQQTQSGLNKSKTGINLAQFDNLLNSTKQLLICDALLSIETMLTFEILRGDPKAAFWLNTSEPWRPNVQYIEDVSDWRDELIKDLNRGLKVYVTTTRGEVTIKALANQIKSVCGDKFPVLCIYGGGEDNADIMADINGTLVKYNCVIASPCMSAGVSFDVLDHFDKVYSFVSNDGPTLVDVIQSLRRVRHIKTNEVVICDQTSSRNLPISAEDVLNYENMRLYRNSADYIAHGIPLKIRGIKSYFDDAKNKLLLFVLAVKALLNRALQNIGGGLRDYFIKQHATFKNPIKRDPDYKEYRKLENKRFTGFKKAVRGDINKVIADAPTITEEEYNEIKKLKRLTAEKRAKLEKYQLMRLYGYNKYENGTCVHNGQIATVMSNPDKVAHYNNPGVIDMYYNARYRYLTNEDMAAIDTAKMSKLTDIEKLSAKFKLARHIVINEIIRIVKEGKDVKNKLLAYLTDLQKSRHPIAADMQKISDKRVIKVASSIIRPYGYFIGYNQQITHNYEVNADYKITDCLGDYFDALCWDSDGLLFYAPKEAAEFKPLIFIDCSNSLCMEGAD